MQRTNVSIATLKNIHSTGGGGGNFTWNGSGGSWVRVNEGRDEGWRRGDLWCSLLVLGNLCCSFRQLPATLWRNITAILAIKGFVVTSAAYLQARIQELVKGGGGARLKIFLRVVKMSISVSLANRGIFACFLLIPYSHEHIGRQYTCPRLHSVHWFDDTLKVISLIKNERIRQLKHFSAVDSSSLIRIMLSREFLVLPWENENYT